MEDADAVWESSPIGTYDLLAQLVNRSLVIAEPRGERVWFHLLETLREFARERIARLGEVELVGDRHAQYFLTVTAKIEPLLERNDLGAWLDYLEQEHGNLRAALAWLRDRGDVESGLRMATHLRLFWHLRGHLTEGREWLAQLLQFESALAPAVRANALDAIGFLARFQGDFPAARRAIGEGLAIRRLLGDRQAIIDSLSNLGSVHLFEGENEAAEALYRESLATNRALENQQGIADALSHLGLIAFYRDDFAAASRMHAESLQIWQALGDGQGIGWALFKLADVALHEGRLHEAEPLLRESLKIRAAIGHTWGIAESIEGIGRLAALLRNPERALTLAGAGAALSEASSVRYNLRRNTVLAAWLQDVRRELNTEVAQAAYASGQAMPLGAAIDYALTPDQCFEKVGVPTVPATLSGDLGTITRREREVVRLIVRGLTNREIAAQLVISERTAERHVENVLDRLGLKSRAQIAVWGLEHGAVRPS